MYLSRLKNSYSNFQITQVMSGLCFVGHFWIPPTSVYYPQNRLLRQPQPQNGKKKGSASGSGLGSASGSGSGSGADSATSVRTAKTRTPIKKMKSSFMLEYSEKNKTGMVPVLWRSKQLKNVLDLLPSDVCSYDVAFSKFWFSFLTTFLA